MEQPGERKKKSIFVYVSGILGLVVALWGTSCEASLFGDYWSRFDRFLATFDPAGRYIRQPIEKEIPALTFKGFYRQWSAGMLKSDNLPPYYMDFIRLLSKQIAPAFKSSVQRFKKAPGALELFSAAR